MNACGDLTYHGSCQGTVVHWCDDDGTASSFDCANIEKNCDWINDEKGYNCVDGPACGDLTYDGVCEGEVATWCTASGSIKTRDCAAEGLVCGWLDESYGYYCKKPNACGDLTYQGACEDDVATWCDSGAVKTEDCSVHGQTCGWAGTQSGYYCVDVSDCGELSWEGQCEGAEISWCDEAGKSQSKDCAAYGMACGYVDASIGYYCLD
jgi:hypothetical protein